MGGAADKSLSVQNGEEFLIVNGAKSGNLHGVITDRLDLFHGFGDVFRGFRVFADRVELCGEIFLAKFHDGNPPYAEGNIDVFPISSNEKRLFRKTSSFFPSSPSREPNPSSPANPRISFIKKATYNIHII